MQWARGIVVVWISPPTSTRGRLRVRFGAEVDLWWHGIPELVSELCERWGLFLVDAVGIEVCRAEMPPKARA
jgi:hypothetical protein